MIRQQELIEMVSTYMPDIDEALLNKAYVFAMKKHGSQMRESGDPYFQHPVEVAALLATKHADMSTIICGLLHDTIEDTDTSVEEIIEIFGKDVGFLTESLTKIPTLNRQETRRKLQGENLHRLFLASTKDIRVLLVKLADRTHNMRTLHFVKAEEKRKRIAQETLDIYSPICERVGLKDWGDEMANLAFAQLEPNAYEAITKRLEHMLDENIVSMISDNFHQLLLQHDIPNEVKGRRKMPYSVLAKSRKKGVGVENLSDIIAFRMVVEREEHCYKALWLIHTKYVTVPGRFKDYISAPKPNGYQAIHTIIQGPDNQRIEVQIRTKEMDDLAERGIASHWAYKQDNYLPKQHIRYDNDIANWIKDIITHVTNSDFIENTKMNLYADRIFICSPKGDYYDLPQGATALDFAFKVHTELGKNFSGCVVNGRARPALYTLKNGDIVSIIKGKSVTTGKLGRMTDNKVKPLRSWLLGVKTQKARHHLEDMLRDSERVDNVRRGRAFIARELSSQGLKTNVTNLKKALKKFGYAKPYQLYHAIGNNDLDPKEVLYAIFPRLEYVDAVRDLEKRGEEDSHQSAIICKSYSDHAIHLCSRCYPIPGDKIYGMVHDGAIHIHRETCPQLVIDEAINDVIWQKRRYYMLIFKCIIAIKVEHRLGALSRICELIAMEGANIDNIEFTDRKGKYYSMNFILEIIDHQQLDDILQTINDMDIVDEAKRLTL